MTSITYRYWCVTENNWVEEERLSTDPAPTVCKNDMTTYQPGSLAIVEFPEQLADTEFQSGATIDFEQANVVNLSHSSLEDAGTHTHAQIDTHIDNVNLHREIDDAGSASTTTLWSSSKIVAELANKAATAHTHTASQITDFSSAVSAHSDVAANNAHRADTSTNPHSVTKTQVGLGNVQNIKNNFSASGAPTATDDANDAYSVGSQWSNGSAHYVCLNATATAAVWKRIDITSHGDLSGVGTKTHAEIDTHINNADIHREIDDTGSASATTLWSSNKIASELTGKAAASHTHTASQITDFDSAADTRADGRIGAQKGVAGGLATLDGSSKIPTSQLPALAITNVFVVADIAARDALTVQSGDVAKVTDSNGSGHPQTYIYDGSAWVDIQETSDVVSVNGQTGQVVLSTSHIDEGTNLYYTDARFDSRLATKTTTDIAEGTNLYYTDTRFDTRFNVKTTDGLSEGSSNLYYTEARVSANSTVSANSAHTLRTDNPHNVTKSQLGLSNVPNTKSNLSATTNPTVGDDTGDGYTIGSRWINTTTGHEFVCVDATASNAVWKITTSRLEQISVDYTTRSSTPVVARTYLYRGSSISGIKSVKVIASIDTLVAGFTFDVRVIDYSNSGVVIAQATGLSGSTKQIHDLGTVSNVPNSDSIFEVQVNRSGLSIGSARVTLDTLAFEFN